MLPNGIEILGCRFSAYGLTAALGAFLAWLLLVRLNDRETQPLSDGLIFTGPTGTNVNDFAAIIIK